MHFPLEQQITFLRRYPDISEPRSQCRISSCLLRGRFGVMVNAPAAKRGTRRALPLRGRETTR